MALRFTDAAAGNAASLVHIYYHVSFFMYLIGNWREPQSRKIIYNGLAGSITVTVLFCGYSYQMKRSYGVFTPSAISVINKRLYDSTRDRYRIASGIVPFILIEPINPNTGTFLLLLAITAGIVVAYICKRKRLPWTTVLLLLFAAGNIAVTVMGAPDDYGRLQLPSFPAELLLLGLIIQMIKDKTITDNKFEN